MTFGKKLGKCVLAVAVLLLGSALAGQANAQVLSEDFDAVTGTGGGVFLDYLGFGSLTGWDEGIEDELAFGQASGLARLEMSAQGLPTGGVDSSGAGELAIVFESLNMLDEDFETVTGVGGGVFLAGDGVTPNMTGSSFDWDSGIEAEEAFCVTRDGAVLGGDASASGLVDAGVGDSGAGRISVTNVTSNGGSWYAGMKWTIPGFPGGSGTLQNPGFDLGGWDTIPDWDVWADTSGAYQSVLITDLDPQAGPNNLKIWGRAQGRDSSGVQQDVRATEGQTWQLDCWTKHVTGDALSGTENYVQMRMEFYDGINAEPISTNGAVVLDGSSTRNIWIDNTPIQATAPAGTMTVRVVLEFVCPAGEPGAAFIDTVTLDLISGSPAFDLGDYNLTADIKGDANTGAGEVYGNYLLRLEDSDGDSLEFQSPAVADGTWQVIGDDLDQAVEKDSTGAPATGVFDADSETLSVALVYGSGWGTGGTLTVDNLVLTNDRADGSNFSGGLIFQGLEALGSIDPNASMLAADVKAPLGAPYELRLQGYIAVPNVDDDFSAITTDTEEELAGPGDETGTLVDWNSEISNDEVFFGTVDATVTETGGAWVRALTTGGYSDDGSCIQIEVLDIWPEEEGRWFAGSVWRNQAVGTDLSQMEVTAKVKGTWNATWLQEPAQYILKVEDPDGDWIGFEQVYDGTYQSIGGLLSNVNTSGLADDGNGVFDLDADLDYNIVIVFIGKGAPSPSYGNWGGTLTIDDVYLSPSPSPKLKESGRVAFTGIGDGTFQSVGGMLADGESTWPAEGGQFYPDWGTNIDSWDAGIEGESAFAGFGWGALIDTASAEGCATCGVGGSGGGMFTATGLQSPPGWYWVGVAWRDLVIDLSDLSQASFSIAGKGVWNAAAGELAGNITVRLEDTGGKRLSWDSPAVDGNFNTIGGTLNTFTMEDGFDVNSPVFMATIIVFGSRTPDWGTGTTVYFDNVTVTDPSGTVLFEDFETVVGPRPGMITGVDEYAITLTMDNGVFSWPAGGSLVVDNLLLSPVAHSCDADDDLDLADFASFQVCFSGEGGGVAANCECADADGDGDVDLNDYAAFSNFLTGPQ